MPPLPRLRLHLVRVDRSPRLLLADRQDELMDFHAAATDAAKKTITGRTLPPTGTVGPPEQAGVSVLKEDCAGCG